VSRTHDRSEPPSRSRKLAAITDAQLAPDVQPTGRRGARAGPRRGGAVRVGRSPMDRNTYAPATSPWRANANRPRSPSYAGDMRLIVEGTARKATDW